MEEPITEQTVKLDVESALMDILCAACRKPFVHRVQPEGLWDRLLALFYIYPFRCQVCRHQFHIMQWGIRYKTEETDRRKYKRMAVRVTATVSGSFGTTGGLVKNLTISGCSIETTAPLQIWDKVSLKIDVEKDQPIKIDEAVVRRTKADSLGIEFMKVGADEERLSKFILELWATTTRMVLTESQRVKVEYKTP